MLRTTLLATVWAALAALSCARPARPPFYGQGHYYKDDPIYDHFQDDDAVAIEALRARIKETRLKKRYGVVMVAGAKDAAYSQMTIPIWHAYCKQHDFDFFLQEQKLNTMSHFAWTKPRTILELLNHTNWRYMWVVDSNSLPVEFNRSWTYSINEHMRHRRWKNDKPKDRVLWCPQDCYEEYNDHIEEGACFGALPSGCIYWSAKKLTRRIVMRWYGKRWEMGEESRGIFDAFEVMKSSWYEEIVYSDVQKEMGKHSSSFMATYHFSEKHQWNRRDAIAEAIKKNEVLAAVGEVRVHMPGNTPGEAIWNPVVKAEL